MKKTISAIGGFLAGALNGLLGAGGGMIIVPTLTKLGLSQQKAHATSVCIILPFCVFSASLYLSSGKVTIQDALPYLGWGVLGASIGTYILSKINEQILRRMFGLLMIWAAYRMVFR